MAKTYIGLHPNDLNRTDYGQVVLYVEGVPVAFFSGSGDVTISGSLAIEGITNVSASIAAAGTDTGSFMVTGSVSGDTITFTKGDGTTFQVTINNVASASYATVALSASFATNTLSASFASTALSASFASSTLSASFASNALSASFTNTALSASFANNALSASFASTALSASFASIALSASFANTTISASYAVTASHASFAATASRALTMSFDGNRAVTQPLLPDLVNYTPGTSTVVDFLNQVFYPEPGFGIEITTNEPFVIMESEVSGSHVRGGTAITYNVYSTASFTANTPVTWSLQSNSVLDINPSTGKLFVKINLSGSALYQAPTTVAGTAIATTSTGGFKTRPFTVSIIENAAPSISVTNILSYTPYAARFVTSSGANIPGSPIAGVYITNPYDPTGTPTITEMNGPDASKFTLVQNSQFPNEATYYRLQTTQALNSGSYNLNFTGSDGYGQIAQAEVTFEIAANTPPSMSIYSGFSGQSANLTSGSTFGTIQVSNDYGDTVGVFSITGPDAALFDTTRTFNLYYALPYTGEYLALNSVSRYAISFKSDAQVGSYNITASATDDFRFTSSLAIPNTVVASIPTTPTPNGTFYIIESGLTGDSITTTTTGIAGTAALLVTNQPVSWSIVSDQTGGLIAISGSNTGLLTLGGNLSGSGITPGTQPVISVKATNSSNLSSFANVFINVTDNVPATVSISPQSPNNYNTVSGRTAGFGTVTVTDPQSYENVRLVGIGGPAGTSFTTSSESPAQSVVYQISSSINLNSGSYVVGFTASDAFNQLTYATQTYTITPNLPPTIPTTTFSKDITLAVSGASFGTLTATDGDSLEGLASVTLSGTDSSKFVLTNEGGTPQSRTYNLTTNQTLSAGGYNVTASAVDNFGFTTAAPLTVTVTVDAPSIPTANGQFFIIESAVSGSDVTTASSGIAGTKAKFTTNQTVTWSLQSGAVLAISQSGELSIKVPMSGSAVYSPGSVIADRVIATNQFNASENFDFQVLVTDDLPPVITNTLADKNNNKTTTATGFGTITVSDPQSLGNVSITDFNGPNVSDFTFTAGPAGSTRVYTVSSSAALNSGSYNFSVTASDAYAQTTAQAFTINVIQNLAPTVTLNGFSRDLTGAVNGATVGSASIADPQDDSIVSFTLSGTDSSKFATNLVSSTATTALYRVTTTQNLTTGSYNLTGSATDSFGLTTVTPIPVTITSTAPAVPIQNAVNFYIIESALSGSNVVVNNDGFTGVQADMNTDQVVTWSIKSPSTYLAIDSNGGLSVKTNISGSAKNASGAPFNLISEYAVATNAVGGSSEALVNVQVAANAAPILSYTGLTVNEGSADVGDTVGTVTATDPQSLDSITSVIISGGANAGSFELVETGATSYTKSYNINVSGSNLVPGSYSIQLTGRDSFNKTTVETKTVTVNSVAATNTVYVYGHIVGANSPIADKITVLGDAGGDGVGIVSGSLIDRLQAGFIGSSSIAVNGGTTSLVKSGSLSTLTSLETLGSLDFSGTSKLIVLLFPSGSTLGGQPTTMYTGATLPASPSVSGRYALYNADPSIPVVQNSGIYYFSLDSGVTINGFSRWGMIYGNSAITSNNPFYLIPDSGSTP